MAFSNFPLIWRFREVLEVSYQDEKQAKIDCFFLLLYNKKNNAKKTTLGNIHEVNIFCKLRKEVVTHKTQMYFFVKKNLKICVFCVEDFKNAVISRLCVATGLEKSPLCRVCWLCARTHKK